MAYSESDHPRWKPGTPYGLGGQYRPKGVNTIAEYRKYLKKEGEPLPEGMGSGGSSGSKSSGAKQGGKSSKDSGNPKGTSGPARFTDRDGDGRDDRQLSSTQMKRALAGLPAPARAALARYPAVLGAIAKALKAGENPARHIERLPSNLRGAALKAARKVAGTDSKSGNPKGGKSRKGMVQAEDGSWVPRSFYE